jgi:phage protein D
MAGGDRIWTGPQATRRKAICQILIDGVDVTSRLDPHLISVTVTDKEGEGTDHCAIELDDRDSRLAIPADDVMVQIWLGWHTEGLYEVFTGKVQSVESGFGRKHGGCRLWVDAYGTAMSGKGKSPMQMSWGEGAPPGQAMSKMIDLKTVLEQAAKHAGYAMHIAPELANIERDYWAMGTESFHHFGARLARELGGVFKISGGNASMTSGLSFTNAAGATLEAVVAEWGKNLIAWRIKPYAARPQEKAAMAQYYDLQKAIFGKITKAIGGGAPFGNAEAITQLPALAPNSQVGDQTNEGQSTDSQRRRGTGWVQLNGEPQARAGKPLTIIGARPGVDGTYRIEEAEHVYSRSFGYLTRCTLNYPNFNPGYTPDWRHPGQPAPAETAPAEPAAPAPAH